MTKKEQNEDEKTKPLEGVGVVKRSPSNKQPVKVFADKDIQMVGNTSPALPMPTILTGNVIGPLIMPVSKERRSKFVFNALTIDVEEANKAATVSMPSPPGIQRGASPSFLNRGENKGSPMNHNVNLKTSGMPSPIIQFQTQVEVRPNVPIYHSIMGPASDLIPKKILTPAGARASSIGTLGPQNHNTQTLSNPGAIAKPGFFPEEVGLITKDYNMEVIKQFFQDQVNRLGQKNEELVRENERLKIELESARKVGEEKDVVKTLYADLVSKHELLLSVGRPLMLDARQGEKHWVDRDVSNCNSNTSQECQRCDNPRDYGNNDSELMDEYLYNERKIPTENISVDTKEGCEREKDSSHLRDFITKLKKASEGLDKTAKGVNHKKTSSLSSMQNKQQRKDILGYYVGNQLTKGTREVFVNTAMQAQVSPADLLNMPLFSKLDQRCSSRAEQTYQSRIVDIEVPVKSKNVSKRTSMKSAAATHEDPLQSHPIALPIELRADMVDFRKSQRQTEKQIGGVLQGLLKPGKSVQDYAQSELKEPKKIGEWSSRAKGSDGVRQSKNWNRFGVSIQTSFD